MNKIGIIGFGSMGQWMAEAFFMVPDLKLVGVVEICSSNMSAAQAWGIPVYRDYHQLLDQPLDGVYIATPNALHKEHFLEAIKRQIPTFIEKPVAIRLAESKEMVVAAQKAGVPTLVNFSYRFSPPYERLRYHLKNGNLGDLLACWVRSFRGHGFFCNGALHPSVEHPEDSGGWVIHHAIHGADWLIYNAGQVESLCAQTIISSPQSPSSEGVFAQIKFESGVVGHLEDSVCGYRDHSAGLLGTRGTAIYCSKTGTLRFQEEPSKPETGQEIITFADGEGSRHVAARHFAAVMREEAAPCATIEDGHTALSLAISIQKSAKQGYPLKITMDES